MSNNITIEEWLTHFKNILNPKDNTQNTNTSSDIDTDTTTQIQTIGETAEDNTERETETDENTSVMHPVRMN